MVCNVFKRYGIRAKLRRFFLFHFDILNVPVSPVSGSGAIAVAGKCIFLVLPFLKQKAGKTFSRLLIQFI